MIVKAQTLPLVEFETCERRGRVGVVLGVRAGEQAYQSSPAVDSIDRSQGWEQSLRISRSVRLLLCRCLP